MSHFHRELVECPYCFNEEEIVIWDSVAAGLDPDLKEKIFQKDLQNFYCKNCNRVYLLEKPFFYIDRGKKLIFYYSPGHGDFNKKESRQPNGSLREDLASALPTDFAFPLEGFRLRLVSSYNHLIEKIHIFDEGSNDRIIEVVKVALDQRIRQDQKIRSQESEPDLPLDLLFLSQAQNQLIFQFLKEDGQWDQVALEEQVYKQALALLESFLPEEGAWDIVDRTYAGLLSHYASESL